MLRFHQGQPIKVAGKHYTVLAVFQGVVAFKDRDGIVREVPEEEVCATPSVYAEKDRRRPQLERRKY